jgi:hypothetical protein
MVVSLSGWLKLRGRLQDAAGNPAAQVSKVGVSVMEGRVK